MVRSCWKLKFLDKHLTKVVLRLNNPVSSNIRYVKHKPVRIFGRNSLVPEELVGFIVNVHNGINFVNLEVQDFHVGLRFGSFVSTKFTGKEIHTQNKVQKKIKEQQRVAKQKKKNKISKKTKLKMQYKQRLKLKLKMRLKKKKEI